MMAWAIANVTLIHRMPAFDEGISLDGTIKWSDHDNAALILPGGNPHYDLPPPPGQAALLNPHNPSAVDAIALTSAIQNVVASLEVPLQQYADVLLKAEWRETPGVVTYIVVIDPTQCETVNPNSDLFPWRGPGMPKAQEYYFDRAKFFNFAKMVQDASRGKGIREVKIALTNLDDDGGWVPLKHMGISTQMHLDRWGLTMSSDLRRHLCDGGAVWVQVILRASGQEQAPPRTPPSEGVLW